MAGLMARLLWPELQPADAAEGWLPDYPKVTSAQVLEAVSKRHPMDGWNRVPGRWVFCREVGASTGSYGDVQRFDAVAVGLVPSNKYARVVYEVKVSRADWLRELRPITELRHPQGWRSRAAGPIDIANMAARGWTTHDVRKWDAALAVSTEFYFAAPPRCILVDELPPEAGLVEVRPWGAEGELRARVVRQAPRRDTPNPDPGFWAAVLRRAAGLREVGA